MIYLLKIVKTIKVDIIMLDEFNLIKANREYFDRTSLERYWEVTKQSLQQKRLDKLREVCHNNHLINERRNGNRE